MKHCVCYIVHSHFFFLKIFGDVGDFKHVKHALSKAFQKSIVAIPGFGLFVSRHVTIRSQLNFFINVSTFAGNLLAPATAHNKTVGFIQNQKCDTVAAIKSDTMEPATFCVT